LADGICSALSPDGRAVLAGRGHQPGLLLIVPTGVGEIRRIELADYAIGYASWIPGTDTAVLVASKANGPRRLYRVDLATHAISSIGDDIPLVGSYALVSPDGTRVAVRDPDGIRIVSIEDGAHNLVPGLRPGAIPANWTADSRGVYTWTRSEIPSPILRVDVETGTSERWMEIWPMVRSGVAGFNSIRVTPDGERYACSYVMVDSTLFLAHDRDSAINWNP
jgi:hypothetical protein